MGTGEVRAAGHKTMGISFPKGLRNKRKRKLRLKKELELRDKIISRRSREEKEQEWSDEWRDYNESNGAV